MQVVREAAAFVILADVVRYEWSRDEDDTTWRGMEARALAGSRVEELWSAVLPHMARPERLEALLREFVEGLAAIGRR